MDTINPKHVLSRVTLFLFGASSSASRNIASYFFSLLAVVMVTRQALIKYHPQLYPFLDISSVEKVFHAPTIWELFPAGIVLLFCFNCGVAEKGGSWIQVILEIIENESSNIYFSNITGLDKARETRLKKEFRGKLAANVILSLIRGSLNLVLGSMYVTKAFSGTNMYADIAWALTKIFWLYYSSFVVILSIYYFEVVCSYLNTCFEVVKDGIKEIVTSDESKISDTYRHQLLRNVLKNHDVACSKINLYNNFWSKYLLLVYVTLIPIFCVNLYQVIITSHGTKPERILMMVMAFECLFLCTKISGLGAQLNKMAHSPYQQLIRVSFQEYPVELRIKLRLLIQRLSGPRIGFYCSDLFEISHATYFAIILALGQNFFLAVDFLGNNK